MLVGRRQFSASIQAALHIADREAIASFIQDEATELSSNPFAHTSAGTQSHIWAGHSFEFQASLIKSLGLSCLLKALNALSHDESVVQEIFRSGPYRAYVYHFGDGCRIVGAVLHGRPGMALPIIKAVPRRRALRHSHQAHAQQLDLFVHMQHA